MKTFLVTAAMAAAVLVAGTNPAQADGCAFGGYGGGFGGYGGGYGFNQGTFGYNAYQRPYATHFHHNVNPYTATQAGGHLHWHDTSHYHYVPTQVVRQGYLYRVQPGGLYLHQDGHWDLHH